MSFIAHQLQVVQTQIIKTAETVRRNPKTIRLVAVSKNFDLSYILKAVRAGQLDFGENYVQEALNKISKLKKIIPHTPVTWHFIGSIQNNKIALVAKNFDWVHSVTQIEIAQKLSLKRPIHLPPLNICLQVNLSTDNNKNGLNPINLLSVAHSVVSLTKLRLRGLMTIATHSLILEEKRLVFRKLQILLNTLNQQGITCDTLSMGMSDDMESAIVEGATIVRIGKKIFGQRHLIS